MPLDLDSAAAKDRNHVYFPEWADRPTVAARLLEADNNSYLAGGYSEEFGYHDRPELPPIFPTLDGVPEQSQLWSVQIEGLHPGYPECPNPHDRDPLLTGARTSRAQEGSPSAAHRPANRVGVIRVREPSGGPSSPAGLNVRMTAAWTRIRTFGARLRSAIGGVPL